MATPTRVLRPTQTARKRPRVAGWNTTTAGVRPRSQWAFLTGDDYPASPWPATEADAMGLPPFGRGVALLANAVAGTGWHAARWDPEVGVSVRLTDQPSVVTDPDPETTPWNYRWAATEDLILYGNHFAIPGDLDYRTLRPGWLTPVPADAVWILQDPTDPSWFRWVIGGTELAAMDLFHVSAGNRSGEVLGRGCLSQYGKWLGGAVAAEEHSGDYFAGGALPPAVLQSPMVLTESQATDLKAKWRDMVSTREPVVLPAGYVLTPVVSNAETSQLVESRQWNASAIAMLLGIPSYKLGLQGPSMTYQNVEMADIEFVRDSVDRYGKPLSEAFTKWLTPRGTSVEWDYAGRMRADQSTTAKVLTTYTAAGILTKDEARAAIGRPPLPEPEAVPAPPTPPELGPDQVVESAADQPPVEGVTTDAGTTD
jgi:HK97 family phage portal protein